MRKCPRCKKRMALGIRWSKSRRKFHKVLRCHNCRIWLYPRDFY